jgi:hypothetical protein
MKQNDNFLVTINDLRAAICTSASVLFRAYTPGPIIAGDFIQEEPLVDLLLRSRDARTAPIAWRALRASFSSTGMP